MKNYITHIFLFAVLVIGCTNGSNDPNDSSVGNTPSDKETIQKIAEKNRDRTVDEKIGDVMVQYLGVLGNDSLEKATNMQTTESGLKYILNSKGAGFPPINREMVTVQYYGMLTDGTKFDSSFGRMEPFTFKVGMGDVIKGWDEGIKLIGKGGNVILFVPPHLGYGTNSLGDIPSNSHLIFFITLDRIYR